MVNQNAINNTLSIITSSKKPLIVIVSAIGRKGFPFATDTLIDSIGENKLSNKEYDRLISLGEIYSSVFLSNICRKRGINSYAVSYLEIGLECNEEFGKGRVDLLSNEQLNKLLLEHDVLILPGFIGATKYNEVITFGRNTSDYSAILIACMYKERQVYIYKDVDGVYPTSINSLNNKLEPYSNLSYEEMIALCDIGFKVVNRKAIEEARNNNIKINIINHVTRKEGTEISQIEANRKMLGFNIVGDEILVASLNPKEIESEISILFKTQHIFIKESNICNRMLRYKLNINQLMIVKQLFFNYFLVKRT